MTLTPQQKTWLPYITLIAAVFAAYANVYHNEFVWDDWSLVVYNKALHEWSGLRDILFKNTFGPYYRPVQGLVYFFTYRLFGLSEPAYHSVNILLHAANACLMYRLGCRLGFYPRAAFAAALLWGVHPLWIEAVAVVSGTSDLLVVFFFLTGLLALLPDFKKQKLWISIPCFILALCSKESAVVFPALATVTLFLVNKERLRPATYIRTWPLWLLGLAYLAGWIMCPVLNNDFTGYAAKDSHYIEDYEHNFINRVLTSLATLPSYLWLMSTPAKLRIASWDFPIFNTLLSWPVFGGITIVAASLAQVIRGRFLPLTWGLLWFAFALSPYTGILRPVDGQLFEHWIYLPAIGLFLGVSQTIAVWLDNKKAAPLAAGLLALATLVLGVRTYQQNEILHTSRSFFEYINNENPSVWSHYQLGVAYFGEKEYEKAAEQWRAVEAGDYKNYLNKGGAHFMHSGMAYIYLGIPPEITNITPADILRALPSSKHTPEAIEEFKLALKADPQSCCAGQFLSEIYYYQGDKILGDYYKEITEKNAPVGTPLP